MRIQRTRLGLGLVLVFALLALGPLLFGSQSGLASAQTPQTMSPGQWQALSETVALNLARAGIPTPYILALTQEYLGAFQQALMLGTTMSHADVLASQHIAAGFSKRSRLPEGVARLHRHS